MFDLLIKQGTLVDGTGAPSFVADVGISGGRIVAIGTDLGGEATEVVDAQGLYVTPGSSTSTPTTTGRPPGTGG